MFDNLSDKFDRAFSLLKGQGTITEVNVASTLKEVRRALLDADVNFNTAKEFTNNIKEKAMGLDVLNAVKPGQMMIKLCHDELKDLMGGQMEGINLKDKPTIILMSGLQGSGKTTFTGKLGLWLKTQHNRRVLLVACDVYRPAAITQLEVVGKSVGAEVFSQPENKNPVEIAKAGVAHAKAQGYNAVIVDTAGRLAIDDAMMEEIEQVKKAINPSETLFVVDAMTGQDAVNTAKTFNDRLNFDGVVLTKLDGDTRGGAALSIKSIVNKPIKFVGTGEKMEALDIFYPERMADRILGMGDVVSLVEKAQMQIDEVEAKRLERKMRKNTFDFDDFLKQIQQIKKMGNLKDVMGMIPGVGKMIKNTEIDDDAFKGIEAMIKSMTLKERQDYTILDISRKKRIAGGAGVKVEEVNALIKQFVDMRKMMKLMSNKQNMMAMMKNMKNAGGIPR
ncbi:MAG: signal recognition particle subunit SRP54 [Patiriisocius sp.]|jgi:signal recognition particle subunit SRP54